jgi:predicted RNA-binding protein with PUA-like domain
MARRYWLIKSEPFKYAWEELVADGSTYWDGVRNHEARNNLGEMKLGDLCLYYHSSEGKEVVGVARVCRESYPDPTAEDPQWLVVDVEPVVSLERSVTLQEIKADPALRNLDLIRRSRLSVVPIDRAEFEHILKLGETKLPRQSAPKKTARKKRARARAG